MHTLPAGGGGLRSQGARPPAGAPRCGGDRLRCPQALHVDRYFAALEATRRHLTQLGAPAARITVSGIPIDPVFADSGNAVAMTRKHALDPARWRILVTAGGFGVGPVERLVRALLELGQRAQVGGDLRPKRGAQGAGRRAGRGAASGRAGDPPGRGLHARYRRVHGGGRPRRQAGRAHHRGSAGARAPDGDRPPDSRPGGADRRPPARGGLRDPRQRPLRAGPKIDALLRGSRPAGRDAGGRGAAAAGGS